MAGCCDNVQDLLTSVNDPDKHIRIVYVSHLGALWQSSGCYVCECRVPFHEGVRIREARHVYSWGNLDEINLDENVCHVSSGDVCHVWGGVPTNPTPISSFKLNHQVHHQNSFFIFNHLYLQLVLLAYVSL